MNMSISVPLILLIYTKLKKKIPSSASLLIPSQPKTTAATESDYYQSTIDISQ
jgi:hypothetical protein